MVIGTRSTCSWTFKNFIPTYLFSAVVAIEFGSGTHVANSIDFDGLPSSWMINFLRYCEIIVKHGENICQMLSIGAYAPCRPSISENGTEMSNQTSENGKNKNPFIQLIKSMPG